jgi:hypothetical protein
MKKIFGITILIALAALMIPACDIVDEPYLKPVGGGVEPPSDTIIHKILLEDYTGQKCPNCPAAAVIAANLKVIYGEQLVLLTIHAGPYSVPADTGIFTADFRTPEGDEFNTFFGFPGYPMGMVDRAEYEGSKILIKDKWEAAVDAQADIEAQADIVIDNTYNPLTRELDCLLESKFLVNMEGTYNICVFITESGIISPQQTSQGVDSTYEHNHVLRTSMNGSWGDVVGNDGQAVAGAELSNNYSYILPAAWNDERCGVVAFIYNTATLEIVQAEEKNLAK